MSVQIEESVKEGDFHKALQSLGRPRFTPHDGSWMDWVCQQLYQAHHYHYQNGTCTASTTTSATRKRLFASSTSARLVTPIPSLDSFLKHVSEGPPSRLSLDEHELHWRCYVDLCRHYHQPVLPFVYHTTFLDTSIADLALAMAQRADIQGLDILRHYFLPLVPPSWDLVDVLSCTLSPKVYAHLIPWNDPILEQRLTEHVERRLRHSGQKDHALEVLEIAIQYIPNNPALYRLRDEYSNNESLTMHMVKTDGSTENNLSNMNHNSSVAQPENKRLAEPKIQELEQMDLVLKKQVNESHQQIKEVKQSLSEPARVTTKSELEHDLCTPRKIVGPQTPATEATGVSHVSKTQSDLDDFADLLQSFMEEERTPLRGKDNVEMNMEYKDVMWFLQELQWRFQKIREEHAKDNLPIVTRLDTPRQDNVTLWEEAQVTISEQARKISELESMLAERDKEILHHARKSQEMDGAIADNASNPTTKNRATKDKKKLKLLEQTVHDLERRLKVMTYEHDLERTADKARIEYMQDRLQGYERDQSLQTTIHVPRVHASEGHDEQIQRLALALEYSEQSRAQSFEKLHQEREFYAEKLRQLNAAFRRMMLQRSTNE